MLVLQADVTAAVAATVASVMGREAAPTQPLMEAGLDSLGVVELRNALAARFGVELPPTVTLDHPTIAVLAQYIAAVSPDSDIAVEVMSLSSWGSAAGSKVSMAFVATLLLAVPRYAPVTRRIVTCTNAMPA